MGKDGGIVGAGGGQIISCYNVGKVYIENVKNSNIGGIIGYLSTGGEVKNCYNLGEVSGAEYSVGRICGLNQGGIIEKCYNLGIIKGNNQVGGVIGANYGEANNLYATIGGKSESGSFGAIVGNNSSGKISNCYYSDDMQAIGEGSGEATNLVKLNEEDMPSILSVVNTNGDFKKDANNINNGYPILNWE